MALFFRMMEVQHQNGYHPAGSPLPPSHTPSPGLTNGSPSSVKNKDLRATNLKVVIPSTQSGAVSQPGQAGGAGLLGISRSHEDVSAVLTVSDTQNHQV